MRKFSFKAIAVAAALSIGALAASYQPAEARSRTPAIIAGIALGAIIAAAAASHHRYDRGPRAYYYAPPPPPRRYYAPPPRVHYAPPPARRYSYAPAPWTPEWYSYCAQRYRSFDPRSGTFQPYNGPRRLCR